MSTAADCTVSPSRRTLSYAECPHCGRTDFRAALHRRNHVDNCEIEHLPLRFQDAARSHLDAERARRRLARVKGHAAPAPKAVPASKPRPSLGPWLEELDVDWAAKARGTEIGR